MPTSASQPFCFLSAIHHHSEAHCTRASALVFVGIFMAIIVTSLRLMWPRKSSKQLSTARFANFHTNICVRFRNCNFDAHSTHRAVFQFPYMCARSHCVWCVCLCLNTTAHRRLSSQRCCHSMMYCICHIKYTRQSAPNGNCI